MKGFLLTCLLPILIMAIPPGVEASPARQAFTIVESDLYRLDLGSAKLTALGETGLSRSLALTADATGILYVVTSDLELFTLDPENRESMLVGPLNIAMDPESLAFDDIGDLWMADNGALFSIDISSGAATAIGPDVDLIAVAARGSQLFGITRAGTFDFRLVALDKTSGVAQEIAPITGTSVLTFADLDFDREGTAWLLGLVDIGIGNDYEHVVARVIDLQTGFAEEVSRDLALSLSIRLRGFALSLGGGLVAIPTLGPFGLVLLAVVLIDLGWRRLQASARG